MEQLSVKQRSRNLVQLILVFVITAFLIGSMGLSQAKAFFITSDPGLPPIGGEYVAAGGTVAEYDTDFGTLQISSPRLGDFMNVTRFTQNEDEIEVFMATLYAFTSEPFVPIQLSGPVEVKTYGKTGNTTGSFLTEILSMYLTGNMFTSSRGWFNIEMREQPIMHSVGTTTIIDLRSGVFLIDSFFDVFTEISFDGGQTWIAQHGDSLRWDLMPSNPIPVPSTMLLLGSGVIGLAGFRRKWRKA